MSRKRKRQQLPQTGTGQPADTQRHKRRRNACVWDDVLLWVLPYPVVERHFPHLLGIEKSPTELAVGAVDVAGSDIDDLNIAPERINIITGTPKAAWVPKWKPVSPALPTSPTFTFGLKAVWTAPKEFAHPQSNEDAATWVPEDSRAAVFDGATESFAAQRWARLLEKTWSNDPRYFLDDALLEYENHVSDSELSWMHIAAAERGSFATMAAVQAATGGLIGTLVGDSCILLVHGSRIIESFPYTTSEEFTSAPDALATAPQARENTRTALRVGRWNIPIDLGSAAQVVLATDAVAAWLLAPNEDARAAHMERAQAIASAQEWEELVVSERASGAMRVDDSTIMILNIDADSAIHVDVAGVSS